MRIYGLETMIGKTVERVDLDYEFDVGTEVCTLTFEDGHQVQFFARGITRNDEHAVELVMAVTGYEGVSAED